MNQERIKQLAKQADTYAYGMNPEQDSYGRSANPKKFQQDRDEKFAELIVGECMEQVWYTREDGINGNVSLVIKERMKQHFLGA